MLNAHLRNGHRHRGRLPAPAHRMAGTRPYSILGCNSRDANAQPGKI
ncbi:hypothetical protein THTE_0486 [Thermogutta terrifontis]|uniref:Uncharacterized protein n=1 Tax=Thermogutta terrifontis TaxID=1331910 RepID=A0A286RAV9_9BACT|nr:hypothetical protein THTE_0486 [Thermogutta terrifontis]